MDTIEARVRSEIERAIQRNVKGLEYLGSGEISMNDVVDAIKPVVEKVLTVALANATGPAGPAIASALTKLVGPGISAVGTQFLNPLESSDPSIASVTSQVPMKGFVRSGSPGVVGITGTLDLGALGSASDTVMTWVLPNLASAEIDPNITVINRTAPAVPGPAIRTFATTLFGSTATAIPLPSTIATVSEFLDRLLPGGVSAWASGTIDKTFGTNPRFRITGKFTAGASNVSFSDLTLGFHVPNGVPGITNAYTITDQTIAELGDVETLDTHIVHQSVAGQTAIDVSVSITGMGTTSGDGLIVVCDCPDPFVAKRANLFDTWAIDPGDTVTFTILVANPTGAPLLNVMVTDNLFFTPALTGAEGPIDTKTFPIARIEPGQVITIDVPVTAPTDSGFIRNEVHATLPCGGCPPPPPFDNMARVVVSTPRVVINEIVAQPKLDWNDTTGGNGVPFDATPGSGVVDASDQWIEITNTGPSEVFIGWTLTLIDAAGAATVVPIGMPALVSGGFIVVPSPVDLATIVTLQLKDLLGVVRDSVDLATVMTALGPAIGVADESIARSPNGLDTGLITDFKKKAASIKAVNPF